MHNSISYNKLTTYVIVILIISFLVSSCQLQNDDNNGAIARVGENYLYIEDIEPLLSKGVSGQDSALIVSNFVNNWAAKKLLLEKSKMNLSGKKLAEFDVLVDDYRTELYSRAYKEALIWQGTDSIISKVQLRKFYESEKENFKLKEKLVKIRFIELPKRFMNKNAVISSLKKFDANDRIFLDSIGVQFKKLNFNDSIWIRASRVINQVPPINYVNESKYLKKSQFFELEDSKGVYLGKILDMRNANEVAPLSFIEPTLTEVLLNRRRLEYARKLEAEIIDEAVKDKQFQIYEQNE